MANLKLPNLSRPSSFIWLAEGQWHFSVRLQCNVLDVENIFDWRSTGLHCSCTRSCRLVRVLWSRWTFMQKHACTWHPPQLRTLSWLLSMPVGNKKNKLLNYCICT